MHRKLNGGFISILLLIPLLIFVFAAPLGTSMQLDITGLHELELGHYQAWAIFDGEYADLGKFTRSSTTLHAATDIKRADSVFISIEPEGDHNGIPSGIIYLSGEVQGDTITLTSPLTLEQIEGWSYDSISINENITYILIEPFVDGADPTGESEFGVSILDGEFVGLPTGKVQIIQ